MRYEKKFSFHKSRKIELINSLINKGFFERYEERIVSSLYYDTDTFSLFKESIEGLLNRKKIRIRFYDLNPIKYFLEIKLKKSELNYKIYPDYIKLEKEESLELEMAGKYKLKKPFYIPKCINQVYQPKIFVCYGRKYFISRDECIRFTVDSDISFSRVFNRVNNFYIDGKLENELDTLELKFDAGLNVDHKLIQDITSENNLIHTRSSKYCSAILSLF